MQDWIRPVDLKINRANQQIKELTKSISDWGSGSPVKAKLELRENRNGTKLIIEEILAPESLEEFGIITGECVHNLRTALDNMVYALARLKTDPPQKHDKISFPIYEDGKAFEKCRKNTLSNLPYEAARLIELIQPFQRARDDVEGRPCDDPLILLRDLSNKDKHRVPVFPILLPVEEMSFSHGVEFYSEADASANVPPDVIITHGPLTAGMIIVEHRTKNPIKSATGEFNFKASIVLQVNDGYEPVDKILSHLNYYTNMVVEQFRPFFLQK